MDYISLFTDLGNQKYAQALANKALLELVHVAVGDGNGKEYLPTAQQTSLKHETWRGQVKNVRISEKNANQLVMDVVLPSDVGGFFIREVGLFDKAGDLIAIANYPETYKQPPDSQVGKQLVFNLYIAVQDTSVITVTEFASSLFVSRDELTVYAKKSELADVLKASNTFSEIKVAGAVAQQAARDNLAIPDGSTTAKGMVQLYNGIDSVSITYGATAAAVKMVADKISALEISTPGASDLANCLKVSNTLSEIKTAGAVAQQAARTNLAIPDGSTTVKGMIQLYNGIDSASVTFGATAAAVKQVADKTTQLENGLTENVAVLLLKM